MDIYDELTERQKGLFKDGFPKVLRHYTKLSYLLKILKTNTFKLSDTEKFKDPKDKKWANAYKKDTNTKKLYAGCFTWETELIHHWHDYAKGKYGCYIAFNGENLIKSAKEQGIICRCVNYIKNIKTNNESILDSVQNKEDIPFSKAWPYRCEYEYRFVSTTNNLLKFDLKDILQIVITSKMGKDKFDLYKKEIEKFDIKRISHSTLEKDIEEEK